MSARVKVVERMVQRLFTTAKGQRAARLELIGEDGQPLGEAWSEEPAREAVLHYLRPPARPQGRRRG